jgi:L-lactate dehydrogenase complex protein LldG
MTSARAHILHAVQQALGADPADSARRAAVDARLRTPARGPVPARGDLPHAERLDLFQQQAETAAATVARVTGWDDVPGAVAGYLRETNRPAEVVVAPHPDLRRRNWAVGAPVLGVAYGASGADTAVGVSRALAGVAETGTLLLRSGPDSPTTLNFLPETHIVAVPASAIVGAYEDAWDMLRADQRDGAVPRSVNLITGPSRTADIEQTLQLGAHGPKNLHIVVVGDGG